MELLALNCGSATVKHKLVRVDGERCEALDQGAVELETGHEEAVARIIRGLPSRPGAVAHRVVHGGDRFSAPALLDEGALRELERLAALAPLHNPAALAGIRAAARLGVPMVAVFDTAFHRTIPPVAAVYAVPGLVRDEPRPRRYGFHGISHRYVTERYAELAGEPQPTIITLHLGNGASATAVRRGESIDTSMGLTPLEGLIMGTRPGDVDAGVALHWLRRGVGVEDLESALYHQSGLKALAGTSDMRELLGRRDGDALLAVDAFCYRIVKYVGAYLAVLGGSEAIVFTGGIGERSPDVRRRVCGAFEWAGLKLDAGANERAETRISTPASSIHAYVIPTDEELQMAREAARLLEG